MDDLKVWEGRYVYLVQNRRIVMLKYQWCDTCDRPLSECPEVCRVAAHYILLVAPQPVTDGKRAGLDCERCWNPVDLCICNPKCERKNDVKS